MKRIKSRSKKRHASVEANLRCQEAKPGVLRSAKSNELPTPSKRSMCVQSCSSGMQRKLWAGGALRQKEAKTRCFWGKRVQLKTVTWVPGSCFQKGESEKALPTSTSPQGGGRRGTVCKVRNYDNWLCTASICDPSKCHDLPGLSLLDLWPGCRWRQSEGLLRGAAVHHEGLAGPEGMRDQTDLPARRGTKSG